MRSSPHRVTIPRRHSYRASANPATAADGFASDRTDDDAEHPQPFSVLLIHGQPGSALIWTRLLPLLRGYGLRSLAIDRPGYGHRGGAAVDQFANAAAVAHLLAEQRSPAVIVGHSLGAGIALALAANAPQHVRALVLVAPAVGAQSITISDRLLAAPIVGPSLIWFGFRALGLALHVAPLRRRILIKRVGLSAGDSEEVVRRITYGNTWRSFIVEQRHLVADAVRLRDGIRRIDCPVLIVAGSRDRIATAGVVNALSKQLPGVEVTMTNTGHLIPIDDPEAVASAVQRAVRRSRER
jgi:pimeloyl-ACP methyl ester carboxylesterase